MPLITFTSAADDPDPKMRDNTPSRNKNRRVRLAANPPYQEAWKACIGTGGRPDWPWHDKMAPKLKDSAGPDPSKDAGLP